MSRLGEPVIRKATLQAMRILGGQFVFGRTIDEALKRAAPERREGLTHSFDMLGEAAMTFADAERYRASYEAAIRRLAREADGGVKKSPGISVKLSALCPKYDFFHAEAAKAALVPMVRDIVRRVDPRQPVSDVRPMEAIVDNATQARATQVTILVTFAALGALLAAVGIHGLLAYTVSSRQHEIGVRLALGAQRRDVVRLVMREAGLLAAAGVVPGIAVAYAVARAMQGLLAGVEPGDVATYLAVALLCSGMVAIGSLAPTLRASRVDPAGALRAEA
jgi:cell division protein FtsX